MFQPKDGKVDLSQFESFRRPPEGGAAWVSPEPVDLDKLVHGEAQIDYSKGEWVFPEQRRRDEPTLADLLMHSKEQDILWGQRGIPAKLKLMQAHRFVLDGHASLFFGNVVHQYAREVLRQHEFARAPFDVTWIEFDCRAYNSVVPTGSMSVPEDETAGFLYDHGTVWCASSTRGPGAAMFMPYRVQLHRPSSVDEELRNCEIFRVDRVQYRMGLFGDIGGLTGQEIKQDFWMSPEISTIVQAHTFEVMPDFVQMLDDKGVEISARRSILYSCAGVLKQVLILLLILTRANKHVYFTETEAQPRRIWMRNRQVPLVSYNHVTMHLHQEDALRRIHEHHTGQRHKWHEVKGHWCESRKKGRGCAHEWAMVDKNHAFCSKGCGAKKWWRELPNGRGDIALGTVSKTWEVTE
jgi:hypothetical protein